MNEPEATIYKQTLEDTKAIEQFRMEALYLIPVLKESVRIREEPDGAVLVNNESDEYIFLSSFEAFILSHFDGTRTIKYITNSLFKNLKNAPNELEIQSDFYRLVQNKSKFIELINMPLEKGRNQINPYIFLSKPDIYKRPNRAHTPLSIELYVTRKCNLNCVYCFANAKYKDYHAEGDRCYEMPLDKINCLIDQIAELQIEKIVLAGGEPTLRPDLAQIIHRLTNYGIKVFLATNAYSISDKQAKELKDAGLKAIQTKLDAANPKTQDMLSGVKGSYEKLIKGIETLKKHSFEVFTAAVVTSWNIKEIPEVIKMCVDLGVDEVRPRIYTPGIWALHGRGGQYLNPSPDSIQWLEKEIETLQEKFKSIIKISSIASSNFSTKMESEMPMCPGLISYCTILENGLIVPCEMVADFSNEFIIGDAKKTSLIDIWNSEKAKRWVLRKNPKVGEPCSSCNEFGRCKGGCPWKSIVAYGMWLCDPTCIKAPNPTEISFSTVP